MRITACLLFLLAIHTLPTQAATPSQAFDRFVSAEMAARNIPGLSIGYARDGVIWAKGYGFADLENRVPARADSSYRLASVTKPMTAAAILHLSEQGRVDLDAEVQAYVPYFPRKPFPVSVRQLLGHLGGINAYVNPQAEQHFKEHKDTRQSLAVFQDFDLLAEPGTRYRYTSYGYNLLGAVIEGATGQSYGEYMKANVWAPLGMVSTRLDDPLELIPHRVRGYQLVGGTIKHSEFIDISSRFSAGGTRSSVPDMLRFGQSISQGHLLSADSRALMSSSMVTKGGELTGYGMGWETRPLDGKFVISHDGVQPETSTYLFVFPSRRLSIAVAANLQRIDLTAFARRLFEIVTGEAWELDAYIRNPAYRPYYEAMRELYTEGRSLAEAGRAPLIDDAAAIDAAFAFINAHATTPGAVARSRHPRHGSHVRIAGSVMAQVLVRSGAKLANYSNIGAIGFFHDYVALYRRNGAIPQARRFTPAFEQAVAALYADWQRTRRAEARPHAMQAFCNAQAYPNHVPYLREMAFRALARGEPKAAMQAAQSAVDYYGDSETAQALLGAVAILGGQRERGERALRAAFAIAPDGGASANALNGLAYQVAGSGGDAIRHAIDLVLSAAALHPADANLRDTLGELYVMAGINDKALLAYEEALALNPQYPNASVAKVIVRNLRAKHALGEQAHEGNLVTD